MYLLPLGVSVVDQWGPFPSDTKVWTALELGAGNQLLWVVCYCAGICCMSPPISEDKYCSAIVHVMQWKYMFRSKIHCYMFAYSWMIGISHRKWRLCIHQANSTFGLPSHLFDSHPNGFCCGWLRWSSFSALVLPPQVLVLHCLPSLHVQRWQAWRWRCTCMPMPTLIVYVQGKNVGICPQRSRLDSTTWKNFALFLRESLSALANPSLYFLFLMYSKISR